MGFLKLMGKNFWKLAQVAAIVAAVVAFVFMMVYGFNMLVESIGGGNTLIVFAVLAFLLYNVCDWLDGNRA